MGFFFKRLETYTEGTPTAAMTDIITEIMVEVLRIFGIATKEIRRGSASEFSIGSLSTPTEVGVEKFLKKLAGRTDLEDAVKKLDRLTQEEARMALTEVLRITHSVRDEVKVVDGKVESMDDKVEDMGDKVEDIGDKVGDIGDKVQCVDEKVQVVIDGAQGVSRQSPIPFNIYTFRRKGCNSGGEGSKISYPTDSKQRRRNQVFVVS